MRFLKHKLDLSKPLGLNTPFKAKMNTDKPSRFARSAGLPLWTDGLVGTIKEFCLLFLTLFLTVCTLPCKQASKHRKQKNVFNAPLFCFIIYTLHMYFPSWVMLFDDYISKEHCCDHVICCGTIDNQSKGQKQRKQLSDFLKTDLVLMKMQNWQLWDWNNLSKDE